MAKNIIRGLLITATFTLALSGCGQKPTSNGGMTSQGSQSTVNNNQMPPSPVQKDAQPSAQKELVRANIKAYYGDEQGTKLMEKEVTINYKEEKDKYSAALWTLKKAPQNSKLVPLAESLGFKSAVLKDKKLMLDVTVSGDGRLGAPGEQLLLEAIRKTLFQFPEVDSIDILVDGKPAESLMGHVDLPHPMKKK